MHNSPRPRWEAEDAAHYRQFLATPTGALFLDYLRWSKPASSVQVPEPTSVALTLGKVQGYDEMLDMLTELKQGQPSTRR